MQISGSGEMGSRDRLADRLAELAGTDSWCSVNGVWLCAVAAGGGEHEHGLQDIHSHRQADCRSYGCEYDIPRRAQQSEYFCFGKTYKNLCHLPYCCTPRLHDHPPRSMQQQSRPRSPHLRVCLDRRSQQLRLEAQWLVMDVWLPLGKLDNDRLRRHSAYRGRDPRT